MMRIIPADARLGRTRTKQNIGYRVLNLDRTPFRTFTVERVSETGIPGCYAVVGGVDAPDQGGYIVWGLETEDIAEEDIKPVAADTSTVLLNRIQAMLETLRASIRGMMPPPTPAPIVQMDTAPFEAGVVALRGEMAMVAESTHQADERQQVLVSEINGQLNELRSVVGRLDRLNEAANEYDRIDALVTQLSEYMQAPPAAMRLVNPASGEAALAKRIALLQSDFERVAGELITVQETTRQSEAKRLHSLNAIDNFLATVGGEDDQ